MKRRSLIAFIWFWGIWSAGSTLEFLALAPVWPFVVLGAGIAAVIVIPRPHHGSPNVTSQQVHEAP